MEREAARMKDFARCLLCYDAPCSKRCPFHYDPAKIIRSLRFHNFDGAMKAIGEGCLDCADSPCEKGCLLSNPLSIRDILLSWSKEKSETDPSFEKADLSADICGFRLENPFLLSSSVVASSYEMCARAFSLGWAGAAFKTISYIDIKEASPRFSALKADDGSFIAFKNIEQLSEHTVEENFAIFSRLKKEFPNKYLLVSIMGRDEKEWRKLAIGAAAAGADGLELNFSCPNMADGDYGSDIGQIPSLVERYTRVVKEAVNIPVIAKLTPNVMTMSPSAEAAKQGGADGLSAINTIKSITDMNIFHAIDHGVADEHIAIGGLSGASIRPIALRFIAELSQNENLKGLHISAMGGIYTHEDALAFLSLGADSLQVTTSVMEHGYRIIDDLVEGLALSLRKRGYSSLSEFKGAALSHLIEVEKMERDAIIYPKFIRSNCIGCGRCYISCRDGGHQAIEFKDRKPFLSPLKCVGCHLCVLVCPQKAILSSEIRVHPNKSKGN